MSKSSDLGWSACRGWQPCNCLRMPEAIRFQESRMSGNLLVRFDEGRVGRIAKMSPSLLLYRETILVVLNSSQLLTVAAPMGDDGESRNCECNDQGIQRSKSLHTAGPDKVTCNRIPHLRIRFRLSPGPGPPKSLLMPLSGTSSIPNM